MADEHPPRRRASSRRAVHLDDHLRVEHLAFLLGNDAYCIPVARVREILRLPPLTRVPRAAFFVLGLVVVRGQVVTTIDLKARLGLGASTLRPRGRILLVTSDHEEVMGLYVDEVQVVHRLREEEIEPTNHLGIEGRGYVLGLARPGSLPRAPSAPGSRASLLPSTRRDELPPQPAQGTQPSPARNPDVLLRVLDVGTLLTFD